MKIGIIQLRGAGDALIALPIAKYYFDRGVDVHWVIDQHFYESFKYAAPYVTFHPLSVDEKSITANIRNPYWFETPRQILIDAGCTEVISFPYEESQHPDKIGDLAHRLEDPVPRRAKDLRLSKTSSFDRFKYVAANVPFSEKWNLELRRNMEREFDLFKKLECDKQPYIVTHLEGAMGKIKFDLDVPGFMQNAGYPNHKHIEIKPITDNIFDWITVLENSSCFIGIDSFYVNLVDQLRMKMKKYFIRRSPLTFTPVLGELWDYVPINLPSDNPHVLTF